MLPAAPPDAYLRWMAFWRDVERVLLEHPKVREVADVEASPFLEGETAVFMSRAAGAIIAQAEDARAAGAAEIRPVIEVPHRTGFLEEIASFLERRGSWLDAHGGAIGIDPLEDDLRSLRVHVIQTVRAAAAAG